MSARHRLVQLAVFAAALVVGCSSPIESGVLAPATASDDARPSAPASASAADASTSPTPSPSPATAATPAPTAKPTAPPSFTAEEQRLVEAIRADARIGCVPRRTDLPAFATAGVECTIGSDSVDRVGAYSFGPATDESGNRADGALLAYTNRLAANGVKLGQGDCDVGRNGDRAWPADLPDEDVDGAPRETRSGCYTDEGHHANVRVTCYGSIYIGVLGSVLSDVLSASRVLRDLYHWTWRVAEGESLDRDPPGICAAPD